MNYFNTTYKGIDYQVEWESIDFFTVADEDGYALNPFSDPDIYPFFEAKVSEAIADKYNEDNPECNPDPADQERSWGKH